MPTIRYIHSGEPWTGGLVSVPQEMEFSLAYESAMIMSKEDLGAIGLEFVPDPVPAEPTAEEIKSTQLATPLVPMQFHAMLRISGQYDAVLQAIEAMSSPDKEIAQAKLDYSTSFVRTDPLVLALMPLVGIDSDTMDQLWISALQIV